MASNASAAASAAQVKRTSFSGHVGNNASILLEKSKAGIRRSTPDSEAMASSDDEQDQYHHQAHLVMNQHGPKTARRASWLSDLHQVPQRKVSVNGSMTFSPATTSYSPTTVIDQNSRTPSATSSVAPTLGRIHSNSASFPWGSTIWNGDAQKGPPSRLTEVLPSPTSLVTPSSTIFRGDDPLTSPTIIRDTSSDSAIPFAIPLHPTPKTYRSQSYSVGQLDPDTVGAFPGGGMMQPASTNANGRPRTGSSFVGLQHRPSRPSMLGDLTHDPSILGQLREVDDDDESSTGSEACVHLSDTQARTIEQLAMENALLRKAAAKQQHMTTLTDSGFLINRTSNSDSITHNERMLQKYTEDGADDQQEYDLNDIDPLNAGQAFDQNITSTRRFSELYANSGNHFSITGTAENRKIESVKKGHWQSSLGFGGLSELPQSRRHSFADIPTRHGSISSVGEPQQNLAGVHDGNVSSDDSRGFGVARPPQGDNASYFSNMDPSIRSPELYRPSDSPTSMQQAYTIHTYNRPQHLGHSQPHPGQLLCMVTFKACRAEVYYVQEGTGLHVKTGDLVIVEADRGTDLGTVAQTEITWPMAKELKEHYVEEHYKWLMMFSRHGQSGNSTTSNPIGPASSAISVQMSAIGGMGPPGQIPNQDPQSVELKPKMVKRLAQAHEIQTLRDKEGNEAKAKRVCQQKVIEHRLNMEILDAEFQMDWKKLTFYYFADAYINFNSLVTDLFKIYKTRIWMSAINPASFVTPSPILQLGSSTGPGTIAPDRDRFTDTRNRKDITGFFSAGLPQISQGGFDQAWNAAPDISLSSMISTTYPQIYNAQATDPQQLTHSLSDFNRGIPQVTRSQSPFSYHRHTAFRGPPSGYANTDFKNGVGRQTYTNPESEWNKAFQGLSLGS